VVTSAVEHVRIQVPGSVLAPGLFADFYRFSRAAATPLACYWGGAISRREYEARRHRFPVRLVSEWEAAAQGGWPPPDLLIVSMPSASSRSRVRLRADVVTAFYDELLARSPNRHPRSIGYIGYSAGAWVATCLGLDIPASLAVATVGGVGMAEALVGVSRPALARVRFSSSIHTNDPVASETHVFQNALEARGIRLPIQVGSGGHDFDDYAASRLVRGAFAAVMTELERRSLAGIA
jgi:hypothetical protein